MSPNYLNKLHGKRVLIFGGTSGIGHAVAEASLEHGASIIIAGSSQERLDNAAQKLRKSIADASIETYTVNLAETSELENAFPELLKSASHNGSKPIDHIIWTAGDAAPIFTDLSGANLQTIQSAIAVRLLGPVLLGHAIAATGHQHLLKSSTSSITFTGGAGGIKAVLKMVGTGLEGLVKGLAVELAPIRVNVVHPGLTLTEALLSKLPDRALEGAKQGTLTKTLATPEDVAEAYLYAMKNNAVTAQALVTDNGKSASL